MKKTRTMDVYPRIVRLLCSEGEDRLPDYDYLVIEDDEFGQIAVITKIEGVPDVWGTREIFHQKAWKRWCDRYAEMRPEAYEGIGGVRV